MNRVQRGERCLTCGRYYDRNVAIDGVVFKNSKVLMIRRERDYEVGKWALPGGVLDWGETVEEAVVREVKEETGVKTEVERLLGVYSAIDRSPNDLQVVSCTFLLMLIDDSQLGEGESQEVRWFDTDALPDEIGFDHRKIIMDAVAASK